MKRTLLATSLVLLSASAYGNPFIGPPKEPPAPPPRQASEVFLSTPSYCVAAEFSALLLQASSSGLHYCAEADPLPAPTPNWKIHEVHPDYRFGFDLGLTAEFHDTYTNLMASWERFHTSDSSSVSVAAENMLGPFFEIGPDASPYNRSKGHAQFHFDKANLNYGVNVNFGTRTKTNIFAGVGYARIKQTLTSSYSSPGNTDTRSIKTPSRFSGAGPQIGIDFSYRIIKGFHLAGDAGASLLVGTMKNHTRYDSTTPLLGPLGITPPNSQRTSVTNRTQVVPGFEGKIGLAYSYCFHKRYMVSLEAGYQAEVYLNAIQSVDMGSEVTLNSVEAPTVGVYARTFQRTLSNFALAGPYLTFKFGF